MRVGLAVQSDGLPTQWVPTKLSPDVGQVGESFSGKETIKNCCHGE